MQHVRSFLKLTVIILIILFSFALGDDWRLNPGMFNPSGVPSLPFSQPRFADLDADGDQDMILGSTAGKPVYLTNTGTSTSPQFTYIEDLFPSVSELDAEVAVAYDLDADGDLDLITGGYTGLQLYRNTGNPVIANFEKIDGFFGSITAGSNPIADLGDIDNDGDLDLLIGYSEDGTVKLYTNTGSDTAAVFSESSVITLGDIGLYAYPVFCDPDNDGDLDILCGRDGHNFTYYKNNGSATSGNWQENTTVFYGLGGDSYFNSPAIVDINGDGKQDLIYGNYAGPLTYYRNSGTTSAPSWTKNTSLFGGVIDVGGASSPMFVDKDNDGDLDMISGTTMGDIKYYRNDGSSTAATFTYVSQLASLKHSIYSSVTMADVNGDGNLDALVGDLSGNIYYHIGNATGFQPASSSIPLQDIGDWAAPLFIDMDKDGDMDIVAGNGEGYLVYLENQGTAVSPLWTEIFNYFDSLDVGSNCVPAFADLDFDGDYDLLAGEGFRDVHYYENVDGDWIEDTSMVSGITAGQNATPAFADLDGDGDQDLILGNYDGTFDFYENLREVVEIEPMVDIPDNFDLKAYPNPFNPSAALSFQLSAFSRVELSIFDLRGKKIATLLNDTRSAGNHVVNYSSDDAMSTGIYLLRLMVDGQIADTKKITLLK